MTVIRAKSDACSQEEVEGHLRNGKRWPTRWYAQTTIAIDKVVSDVKFAPRHQGLKIATALGDG